MVVAQLVEPQIVILVVAGSSPVDHPISFFCKTRHCLTHTVLNRELMAVLKKHPNAKKCIKRHEKECPHNVYMRVCAPSVYMRRCK